MNAVMPAIKRRSSRPYRWQIVPVPLADVANVEKKVPREFVTADGFGITAACRRYLEPLIAGEDYPPYRDGLPAYVRIKGAAVKRKLKPNSSCELQVVKLQPCACRCADTVWYISRPFLGRRPMTWRTNPTTAASSQSRCLSLRSLNGSR
jgi:hypothetical protein